MVLLSIESSTEDCCRWHWPAQRGWGNGSGNAGWWMFCHTVILKWGRHGFWNQRPLSSQLLSFEDTSQMFSMHLWRFCCSSWCRSTEILNAEESNIIWRKWAGGVWDRTMETRLVVVDAHVDDLVVAQPLLGSIQNSKLLLEKFVWFLWSEDDPRVQRPSGQVGVLCIQKGVEVGCWIHKFWGGNEVPF